MLGGETDPELSAARHLPVLAPQRGAADRRRRAGPAFSQTRLIFTGWVGKSKRRCGLATAVRQLWLALGVPQRQLLFEIHSPNTWENAIFHWRHDQS